MRFASIVFAFILCLSLCGGCKTFKHIGIKTKPPVKTKKIKHKGPPPHAPAHGYRHKHHDGIELEFDNGLGVYFSVKMPGIYFHNGLYMRLSDGHWKIASHFDGPWRPEAEGQVPHKLKKTQKKKHKEKNKGHGKKKKKKN